MKPTSLRLLAVALASLAFASCSSNHSSDTQTTASLVNTYWKLLSLSGDPVVVFENQREPHFVLHREQHRLAGYSGCNHLMGRYQLKANELRFLEVGGTLMACERGMETEARFLEALRVTTRWQIHGERLELFDSRGQSLAKFESVYLR
jgi:heat shock protein HslJ